MLDQKKKSRQPLSQSSSHIRLKSNRGQNLELYPEAKRKPSSCWRTARACSYHSCPPCAQPPTEAGEHCPRTGDSVASHGGHRATDSPWGTPPLECILCVLMQKVGGQLAVPTSENQQITEHLDKRTGETLQRLVNYRSTCLWCFISVCCFFLSLHTLKAKHVPCPTGKERLTGKASHLFIDQSTRPGDSQLPRKSNECFRTPRLKVLAGR